MCMTTNLNRVPAHLTPVGPGPLAGLIDNVITIHCINLTALDGRLMSLPGNVSRHPSRTGTIVVLYGSWSRNSATS